MKSWDLDGGSERYHRYEQFSKTKGVTTDHDFPPRFDYRGLMIDFGRNFFQSVGGQPFADVLIEVLSLLKMNKFHMHLSESQGWRLEIPGLDALTTFGSNRCYGEFENGFPCLWPEPQDTLKDTYETRKFFTREKFIDLLKKAASKNIDIIVEFDFPAHARAAVQSMEYEFFKSGDDQYRLADPDETFQAQGWARYYDDNINVCQDSTYNFIEKVVTEENV